MDKAVRASLGLSQRLSRGCNLRKYKVPCDKAMRTTYWIFVILVNFESTTSQGIHNDQIATPAAKVMPHHTINDISPTTPFMPSFESVRANLGKLPTKTQRRCALAVHAWVHQGCTSSFRLSGWARPGTFALASEILPRVSLRLWICAESTESHMIFVQRLSWKMTWQMHDIL